MVFVVNDVCFISRRDKTSCRPPSSSLSLPSVVCAVVVLVLVLVLVLFSDAAGVLSSIFTGKYEKQNTKQRQQLSGCVELSNPSVTCKYSHTHTHTHTHSQSVSHSSFIQRNAVALCVCVCVCVCVSLGVLPVSRDSQPALSSHTNEPASR